MSECTHNCSTCGESCAERQEPQSLLKAPHTDSRIGKVYGVTRERIRQIEAKALRKLRHPSRSKKLRDFLD